MSKIEALGFFPEEENPQPNSFLKEKPARAACHRRSWELVEATGIEPVTFCLQSRCSPN